MKIKKVVWLSVAVMLSIATLGTAMKYIGWWGDTVVKRIVFTESYQVQASAKRQAATMEAALGEIDRALSTMPNDAPGRPELEARAAGLRIQIARFK